MLLCFSWADASIKVLKMEKKELLFYFWKVLVWRFWTELLEKVNFKKMPVHCVDQEWKYTPIGLFISSINVICAFV